MYLINSENIAVTIDCKYSSERFEIGVDFPIGSVLFAAFEREFWKLTQETGQPKEWTIVYRMPAV